MATNSTNYSNFDFDEYIKNRKQNSNSDTKTSYDTFDFDDYIKRKNLPQVEEYLNSSLQNWLNKNKSFLSSYNDRIGRYQDKDPLDWEYESDSSNWLSSLTTKKSGLRIEAGEIKMLLDQYKDYLNEDYYDSVIKALDGNINEYDGIISKATELNKYWSSFETEDAYKEYLSQAREKQALLAFDLNAGKAEIEALENQYAEVDHPLIAKALGEFHNLGSDMYEQMGFNSPLAPLGIDVEKEKELRALISEKKAYYNLAERAQKAVELASVSDVNSKNYDPEFDKYVAEGEAHGLDTHFSIVGTNGRIQTIGSNVNDNIITFRNNRNEDGIPYASFIGGATSGGGGVDSRAEKFARYMSDEQYKTYAYYYGKYGEKKADEYLDSIEEEINAKEAGMYFGNIQGNVALEYAFGVAAGLDQFTSGIEGIFADGYTPTTSIQYASGMVREDLANTGATLPDWLGGGSVGQVGYDVINTGSNMLPSILASTASNFIVPGSGAVVGAVTMGASAGGNAKAEMLNLGYSKEQATSYGIMVGVAEAGMEYLLGSIPGLSKGDGIFGTLGGKVATKVDNAISRVAIKLGNNGTSILRAVANGGIKIASGMADEALEEGLQTVIEPWLKEIATSVDWDDPSIDEILYSSLLGALSSVALGGAGDVAGEVNTYRAGRTIQKVNSGVSKLQEIGSKFSSDTVAYKIASEVNEQTDAYTIGKLLKEVGGTISEQNYTDIVNGLTERGIRESDAKKIAKQYQAFLNGEMNLTDEGVKILENLSPLADVLRKNIIGANTTVYQRTRAYSDLMNLADEVANGKKGKKGETTEASPAPISEETKAEYERIASEVASGKRTSASERIVKDIADSAKSVAETKLGVEGRYTSSETGRTRLASNKQKVNIVGIDSIKDGTMNLKLDDGSVVSADDIDFSSSDEALVYEAVTNMGVSANTAWEILKAYDPKSGQSGAMYAMGALEAYTYGHNGVKVDGMSKDGFASLLSPVQKNTANRLGDIDARAKIEAQQKTIDKAVRDVRIEAKSKHKPIEKRKGQTVFEGDHARLTDLQKSQLDVLEKVSEGLGVTFHIFESKVDAKGKRYYKMPNGKITSANGWYDPKTGEIWIDLYAGNDGQGTMIFTAAHELTHFIRQWSPAKFKVFADFLFEQYGKKGQDVNQLIRNQIQKAANNGRSISWDEAYEEVIADSCETFLRDSKAAEKIAALREKDASLANKIKTFLGQMLTKMRKLMADLGLAPETDEGQMVAKMTDSLEKLYNLWTDALADAGTAYSTVGGEIDLDGNSNSHILSDRTMVEGAGLQFVPDADGVHYQVLDADGNPVSSVTPEMISNSPLGQLVASAKDNGFLGNGREAEIAATKQYKFLAELVNMCINYDGLAPIWETAGTMVFSSIKSNADKQYGLTIDFSTVCKKTQAIVDAMSEAMVRLGRGLTRSEVETIYLEVGKAGESTPCPVCYVFSRWMGIGGILDQMSRFQDKYTKMSETELQSFIADIKKRIVERANTPNKNGVLKSEFFDKNGNIKEGQVIADLKQKANSGAGSTLNAITKNSDTQLKIQELQELMKRQDAKEAKKTATKIKKLEAKLVDVDALEKQFKEFNDIVEEYEAYQWLTRTLMEEVDGKWVNNKSFKPVPKDVLFDLNKGATFAEDYPLSWAFRTGKGASAGKAITPYADARVGEAIQGVASQDVKSIKTGLDLNPFLNGDEKTRKEIIARAIEKQARQNLIGGQRYQSTSDFRYEYGSDYLITFLEMQAIGAKVQLYTKVIEAVDFLASMGADINLSVMPLSDGYVTLPDGTKKLIYSSVTGIDAEAAIKKSHEYNNVQLILVGISDEHIRLALEGEDVTFVIPFHGSGNNVHQIQVLMNLLGENLDVTTAQDYTAVQSDHASPKQTKDQKAMWDLRVRILTGDASTLTAKEFDILNKNDYLKDLYNRFYVNENADEYGIKLSKDVAGQIFPYEYWDKSLTYAEADKNGERFKEYCASMGIIPRFSGMNSKGENVGFGDFTNNKGYWKLLIDRPMYDNTYDADGNWTGYGKYHEQKRINCSNFQVKHLDPEYGFATYGEVMSKANDPKKTNMIVDRAIAQFEKFSDRDSNGTNPDVRYSDRYSYDALISKPDIKLTTVGGAVPTNRADVVSQAKKNAASIGKTNKDGSVSIYVQDVGTDVILSKRGLLHGLDRRLQDIAPVTVKAGEILQNSIKINELTPSKEEADASYVLIGAAQNSNGDLYIVRSVINKFSNELDTMDVLYAINAKKSTAALNAPLVSTPNYRTTISIAQLLDFVNRYFPDILPESVLRHFGYDARPEGKLGESALYSDRSPSSVSTRTLLANALETTAQNDIEKTKLEQYKSKIDLIEAEYAKLEKIKKQANDIRFTKGRTSAETKKMKALEFEANQIANRINTYDRQLLNLESTTALKNVLQREKELARRKEAKKGKEALAKQKEKQAQTIRTLMDKNTESRKKAIDSRNRTEMRHKIRKVVDDLNNLLLNPTKDKHVPISLQKYVASALAVINMDTIGAEERIAKYNELIAKAKDPDEIARLTKSRDNIELQGESLKDKLTTLQNAYAALLKSDDPLIKNAYDESIENLIANTIDKVGDTSLRNMSLEQLDAVYDMFKAIKATVRNANKMFKEGRQETITANSEWVKREVSAAGGHRNRVMKATKWLKKFGWNMLKPIYAMKLIGSDVFTGLYENVRKGEDTWAVDVNEAKDFFRETAKKYNYKSWDFKKQYTFKDSAGHSFSLSLEQIMSLYAYSKREQADKHLEVGGFIFDDSVEVTDKNKLGIPMKYEVNDATPHILKKDALDNVISTLDTDLKDVKGFVDEMQAYLSDVMGAKGNEVSLAMYDIKLYKEQNYFPLKTAKYFREFDPEKNGIPKIKNSGFSKNTVPQAGNPIVLSNFMDVWAQHINDMSMYHAFVLPLEDFMRVYNYSSTKGGYDSVQQYIKNAYGSQANAYIESLMNDLNGGARTDPATDFIGKGMSLFKKSAVFASLSVVIQQPSAIARAFAYIDPKYFVDKPVPTKHSETWAEVKKYAPVAVIKEMGYFDTNMGRSTVDFITSQEYEGVKEKFKAMFTDSNYRDEILSKAPALADELAWCAIWKAVKREIADSTNLQVGSEEFLKLAGKRFTEVVTKTQVYDSVLSRSALMRSKDTGAKMVTAFMAEPTTSLNMTVDALIEGKRGNKKFAGQAIGAVAASIILNAILVSLVSAARDDDDDETYTEKYLESLTAELIDGFNPLTYIPFVKDIWSIAQGYDIERSDMSIWSDFFQSVENLFSNNKSGFEKVEGVVGAVSSFFGLPLKNIMRDARAMYNLAETLSGGTTTTWAGVGDAVGGAVKSSIPLYSRIEKFVGADEGNSDKLYGAIVSGDKNQIERMKAQYNDDEAIESAIKQGLRENDSRIKEAVKAHNSGDIRGYSNYVDTIAAEGHFDAEMVESAIRAEQSAFNTKINKAAEAKNKGNDEEYKKIIRELRDSYKGIYSQDDIVNLVTKAQKEQLETEDDDIEEATSIYKAKDINAAFESGDNEMALEVIDDLFNTKVENYLAEAKKEAEESGKRFNEKTARKEAETKAKSSIRSSMTTYWKPRYKEAYKSGNTAEKERIERILKASGLYGNSSEVIKTCRGWRTERD